MRLSASRMGTFMRCPLQGKFKYIDGLPEAQNAAATFGSCVHHALQKYALDHDVDGAVAAFTETWKNPDLLGRGIDYWPPRTTYMGYMTKGIEALRAYHEQQKWEKRTFLAAEHGFLVPFGDHELVGYVDLLEIAGGPRGKKAVTITDYKTSSKAPFIPALKVNIQFTVYDYASRQPEFWLGNGDGFPPMDNGDYWWEMTKDLPRQNIWYALMQQKPFDAGERDENDYMRLYRVANEIQRAIDYGVFVPDISGDSCSWCPYTVPCKLPIKESA